MHTVLLVAHIAAGITGLLVAPVAMLVPKRRRSLHRPLGFVYIGATTVLATSAVGLSFYDFGGLAYLAVIAVATEAAALGAWWAIRSRPQRRVLHLNLICSSYISFVTAFLLVQWESALAWILPTVIGTPLIARATRAELTRQASKVQRSAPTGAGQHLAGDVTN